MQYEITGSTLQTVRIELAPGEAVHSISGGMAYMTGGVNMETSTNGGLWKGIKRSMSGGSVFMTTFRADGSSGSVGISGSVPGKIVCKDASQGAWICQQTAFLASEMGVDATLAFQKKLGTILFGGEGLLLQRISGTGKFFINGCGDFIEKELSPGEVVRVSTSKVVAWEESVQYSIERVKGAKNILFSGEGLFVTTLTGPGKVIMQSMTLGELALALWPYMPKDTS